MPDAKISHRFAALGAVVFQRDVAAHLLKREDQSGAQRIHPDRRDQQVAPFGYQRRHHRKCGRGGITRHGDVGGPERCFTFKLDHVGPVAFRCRPDGCAKMAEHGFGVVARRRRFPNDAGAAGVYRCQQNRRFDLCRRNLADMVCGKRRFRAGDRDRQPVAVAGGDRGAHAGKRVRHARHRTAAERGVAAECGSDRLPGDNTHEKPDPGATVSKVKRRLRRDETVCSCPGDVPDAVRIAPNIRAKRLHRAPGGHHVVALQQSADPGRADREAAENQ